MSAALWTVRLTALKLAFPPVFFVQMRTVLSPSTKVGGKFDEDLVQRVADAITRIAGEVRKCPAGTRDA